MAAIGRLLLSTGTHLNRKVNEQESEKDIENESRVNDKNVVKYIGRLYNLNCFPILFSFAREEIIFHERAHIFHESKFDMEVILPLDKSLKYPTSN